MILIINLYTLEYKFDFSILSKRLLKPFSKRCQEILCFAFFIWINNCYGQQVGIGTVNPNMNAVLDISDMTRGVLLPRMDSVHRISIPNTEGLIVYDLSYHALYFNDGNSWHKMQSDPGIPAIQNKVITKESWWTAPGNSTTADVFGFGNSVTGTAVARNVVTGALFTSMRRLGFSSTAVIGSSAGTRHNALQFWIGGSPGVGGFLYIARFGISSAAPVNTQRSFVGLFGSTAGLTNANPSTNVNILGFGVDDTDNTWTFMHNDASGTATKDNLIGTFPPRSTSADMFEIRIYCPPFGSTIYYSIEVLNGGSYYTGSTNTDIPTQLLSPQIWTNNGTTASSCAIDVVYQYIQTNY